MPEAEQRTSTRWWEFYAVRYGMGTVIGAVVFFVLCRGNTTLEALLLLPDSQEVESVQLALLAAYGITYCYIASAPILVFHAARFLLSVSRGIFARDVKRLPRTLSALLPIPAVSTGLIYFLLLEGDTANRLLAGIMVFIFTVIIWVQFLCVWQCLTNSNQLFTFYRQLADKRAKEHEKGEIVDSYRHLREHGNSFFIVTLELLLGWILYAIGLALPAEVRIKTYVFFLFLWVVPSALVWFIGTAIEREFKDDSSGKA